MLTNRAFFNFVAENLHKKPFFGLYMGGIFLAYPQNGFFLQNLLKKGATEN